MIAIARRNDLPSCSIFAILARDRFDLAAAIGPRYLTIWTLDDHRLRRLRTIGNLRQAT